MRHPFRSCRPLLAATVGILSGCSDGAPTTPESRKVVRPAFLQLVSGGDQSGYAGARLRDTVVIRVLDADSLPLSGVRVRFAARTGGGEFSPASATSGIDGITKAVWMLGQPGEQTADARTEDPTLQVTFRASAAADLRIDKRGAALATELAARLTAAGSPDQREHAVAMALNAFDVGVYASAGGMIAPGAERTDADFFLYDFELRIIAAALERGDSWSLTEAAAVLREIAFGDDSSAPDATGLAELLRTGVTLAQANPDATEATLPLLIRELGRQHSEPYDLEQPLAADVVRLDAMQLLLLALDLTLPVLREGTPGGESRLPALMSGIVSSDVLPSIGEGCTVARKAWTEIKAVQPVGQLWWGRGVRNELRDRMRSRLPWIQDGLHGMVLAFSVSVSTEASIAEGHYGHGASAQPLRFRARVVMRDQLPDIVVRCGWLKGIDLPPQGGIPGVMVLWENAQGNLDRHGRRACGVICYTETDAQGWATLEFRPHVEPIPGHGIMKEESGVLDAIALYQSAFGNLLGRINEVVTPKYDGTRWFVSYHEPPDELDAEVHWVSCTGPCSGLAVAVSWTWTYVARAVFVRDRSHTGSGVVYVTSSGSIEAIAEAQMSPCTGSGTVSGTIKQGDGRLRIGLTDPATGSFQPLHYSGEGVSDVAGTVVITCNETSSAALQGPQPWLPAVAAPHRVVSTDGSIEDRGTFDADNWRTTWHWKIVPRR